MKRYRLASCRPAAAVLAVFALALTGLNDEGAAADSHDPAGPVVAPVPLFVFTNSPDPSIHEYVIDEFKKELTRRAREFPFTLVDSREQARVVLEIGEIVEICGLGVPDAMVGISATLTVGSFSAPMTAGGACSPYKRFKYRPLGKKLAEGLARWAKEHLTDAAALSQPVAGSFVGQHGYRIEIPDGYRAYRAPLDGEAEVVFFAPSGTQVTPDESQYAARRIVRLEAWKETEASVATWKDRISMALDRAKEAYTLSDVDVGRPGVLVHITRPREIRQLLVEASGIMFLFTGADEEQLRDLARGIK
jgi:hypothetical protein